MTTDATDIKRHITLRQLEALVPYARNARTHSPEQLAKLKASMLEFGWTNPVIADDKGIVAGHGRIMAARELYTAGQTIRFPDGQPIPAGHVPVVDCTGWSDAKRKAYILADNRLALDAGWDDELLALELADLRDEGFELELTGFSEDEIDDLLDGMDDDDVEHGDDDAAPEPQPDPVSRLGDVWVMAGHRLMCGDSTSIDAFDRLMPGESADLIFTDPPYGMSYGGGRAAGDHAIDKKTGGVKNKSHGMIMNDDLQGADLIALVRDAMATAKAKTKDGAAAYACFTWRTYAEFEAALESIGLSVKACIVWDKKSIGLGMSHYRPQHEFIFYCGGQWYGDKSQSDVWYMSRGNTGAYVHPTQKPVELIERALDNSSKRGDVVIDCFGGSGSTLIACEKTGRNARLMELDPKYVDVIVRRWQEYTGKVATLELTGQPFSDLEAERVPANNNGATPPSTKHAKSHRGLMTAGHPFTEMPAANDADGARDAVA